MRRAANSQALRSRIASWSTSGSVVPEISQDGMVEQPSLAQTLTHLRFMHRPEHSLSTRAPATPDNYIIHGENLNILKEIRPHLRESVRCIYLDPPYNNQECYNHYVDELSHEVWLNQLAERLSVLVDLLSADGSLWISIDDREMHYLKVESDKIFDRSNFVTTIVWQHRTSRENRRAFSNNHEYILVYAKDARAFKMGRSLLSPTEELLSRYKNPDNDPRGLWQSVSANVQAGHGTLRQFYLLIAPNGTVHCPPPGRCWVYTEDRMQREIADGRVWFGRDGNGVPRLKKYLSDTIGLNPETLWLADQVGTTDQAKKHILTLFPDVDVFDTPKPEPLIERILQIATQPGDLVLDPYLGSGTTTAVAKRMGRRYIGIERGPHAATLCARRLQIPLCGEPESPFDEGFQFFRAPRKWQ